MKISATIITLNEEGNIARCIEALKDVADEVIVMDSGSTDNTINICREKGAIVFEQQWLGYAAQKNVLNQKASYDFILSVDADEVLSPELIQEINHIKQQNVLKAFSLNRLTNYCGKWIYHSGWYPDYKIRIFPKSAFWSGEWVHEELILPDDIEIEKLKGHLYHYSYISHDQHRNRADQYSKLTAIKYVQQNKSSFLFQPAFSAFFRFIKMYFIDFGFLDGYQGFHIAKISAASNYFKYKEVQRILREKQ